MFFWQELFCVIAFFSATTAGNIRIFGIFFGRESLAFAIFSDCGGDNGTEDDHRPGAINPNEQDRERRHGAVKGLVGGAGRNGQTEELAEQEKHHHGNHSADNRIGEAYFFVGHQNIEQNQRQGGEQAGNQRAEVKLGADDVFRHKFLQRIDVSAQRERGTEQQRPKGDYGPVEGDFSFDVAGFIYLKYEIEAVFNGGEHQNGGDGDADDTDGGQLSRCINKIGEILADFLFDVGNKVLQDNFLQLFFGPLKDGKSRENGQSDGKQGNNGNQRRIA